MTSAHPFAVESADKVASRGNRPMSLKARSLLNGFGYYRRSEQIAEQVQAYLAVCGLKSDLTEDHPITLDERIAVMSSEVTATTSPTRRSTLLERLRERLRGQRRVDPIANAIAATVEIFTESALGSGFIISPNGLVVTARHVVEEGGQSLRNITVRLFPEQEDEQELQGTVFCSHRQLDYALIWLSTDGAFPALPLGDPKVLQPAQTVYAVGSPSGTPNTVSRGIISNSRASFRGLDCLQTDTAIDFGNSGGPLITEKGEIVGINLWGKGQADARSSLCPLTTCARILRMLWLLGERNAFERSTVLLVAF